MTDKISERPVMISLVSEQAIPNVMAALLVRPRPRKVVCILPADKEHPDKIDKDFDQIFNGIQAALERSDRDIRVINHLAVGDGKPVSPYDAEQVRNACRSIRADPRFSGGPWIYNITGGTKVMAQAALDDARENSHPAVYVDTERRRLIWDGKGAFSFFEDRLSGIGVEEYLTAYGLRVERKSDNPKDDLLRAARFLGQDPAGPSFMKMIAGRENPKLNQEVACIFDSKDLNPNHRKLLSGITSILSTRAIEEREKGNRVILNLFAVDEDLRRFFWGGGWLENYAFDTIRRLHETGGALRYHPPWSNVLFRWDGIENSLLFDLNSRNCLRPFNELDVAAIRGARLLICECKTGRNSLNPNYLYKLQVIGYRLGTFADMVFITDHPSLINSSKSATRRRVVRALTLNITVVQASQLSKLHEILAKPEEYLRQQKQQFGLAAR